MPRWIYRTDFVFNEEITDDIYNRIKDIDRLFRERILPGTDLKEAASIRMIEIHLDDLKREVRMLKERS